MQDNTLKDLADASGTEFEIAAGFDEQVCHDSLIQGDLCYPARHKRLHLSISYLNKLIALTYRLTLTIPT